MSTSLLLDLENWGLVVDAAGNIATCEEPYADAQDAACHVRLFSGELRYDKTQGVPYWRDILGKWPPLAVLKADLTFQALLATNVTDARVFITSWGKDRVVGGIVATTNASSKTSIARWAAPRQG